MLENGLVAARMRSLAHLTPNQMSPRYRSLTGLLHQLDVRIRPFRAPSNGGFVVSGAYPLNHPRTERTGKAS